ncbi:MAG: hypothetical protein IJX18_02925, partial [Clostridia bacterium]|nr:hypothetical protein [Clostridia bacterium]
LLLLEGITGSDYYADAEYNDALGCYEFTTPGFGGDQIMKCWFENGRLVRQEIELLGDGDETFAMGYLEIEYITTTVANPYWGEMFDTEIYSEEEWTQAIETALCFKKNNRLTAAMQTLDGDVTGFELTWHDDVLEKVSLTGGPTGYLLKNDDAVEEWMEGNAGEWCQGSYYENWGQVVEEWQSLMNSTFPFGVRYDEWIYDDVMRCYVYSTEIDGQEAHFYMEFCDGVLSYAWAEWGDMRMDFMFQYHDFTINLPFDVN